MAKVIAGVALVAGAVAFTVVTGGGGAWLGFALMGNTTLSAGFVASSSMMLGTMGAGLTLSSISQALMGGGQSLSQSIRQPMASRVTVYGQTRVAGTIVYESCIGYVVNQIVAWASHQCQSIDFTYLDGREVYFTGNSHQAVAGAQGWCDENTHYDTSGAAYTFYATSGNYHLYCGSVLGTAAGSWLSQLGAGMAPPHGDNNWGHGDPNWDSSCTLNQICASFITASSNTDMFNGIPNPKAALHGKCDIYDPRLGAQYLSDGVTPNPATHIWTDNAALIVADFLVNQDFGVGCDWDEIDIDQLVVAANICDEQVELAGVYQTWKPNWSVTVGTQILDSNGNIETATIVSTWTIGETGVGPGAPAWPTTVGGTVHDKGVTWTMSLVLTVPAYESRYTINGSFDWSSSPGDVLNSLLSSMEARISYQGGVWKIFPAAWYGSTLSFGLGDLTGPIKWISKRKKRELFNAVRSTFICPSYPYAVIGYDKNHKDGSIFDGQYQPTDAPEYAQDALHGYASDANLAADGGIKLYSDSRYQYVTSVATVQRLMKIRLLRNRQQGSGTLAMDLSAYQTCPQDVIQFTAAPFGWTNKYLEVSNFRFSLAEAKSRAGNGDGSGDQHKALTMGCELDVCETDPSVYGWSLAEERNVDNSSSPQIADSRNVIDPNAPTLESDITTAIVSNEGVATPRISVTWAESSDPFTTDGGTITVQFQLVGASGWQTAAIVPGYTTQCYIGNVVAGLQYNVQICAAHASGASGNWIFAGPVTVSTMSATAGPNASAIGLTLGTTAVTASWSAQTVNGISVVAGSVVLSGLTPGTTYYTYWYISQANGSINAVGAPVTSPSYSQSIQAAASGCISLGCIPFTTLAIGQPVPAIRMSYPPAS